MSRDYAYSKLIAVLYRQDLFVGVGETSSKNGMNQPFKVSIMLSLNLFYFETLNY
jgi:hypothetical protein